MDERIAKQAHIIIELQADIKTLKEAICPNILKCIDFEEQIKTLKAQHKEDIDGIRKTLAEKAGKREKPTNMDYGRRFA